METLETVACGFGDWAPWAQVLVAVVAIVIAFYFGTRDHRHKARENYRKGHGIGILVQGPILATIVLLKTFRENKTAINAASIQIPDVLIHNTENLVYLGDAGDHILQYMSSAFMLKQHLESHRDIFKYGVDAGNNFVFDNMIAQLEEAKRLLDDGFGLSDK